MRTFLLNAPWWVLSLVHGAFFGVFMAIASSVLLHTGWIGAVVGGLVGGVFFGAAMGPVTHRLNSHVRETVGSMPATSQRAALRATLRGPVPEDQHIREAAHRLATRQLAQMRRLRTFLLITYVGAVILYVVVALLWTPWWWIAVAFFAVMFAVQLWLPRRLQRRIELLGAQSSPGSANPR